MFTIKELFLLCSDINEYTEFVVFEDFNSYMFDTAPIAAGCLDDLEPEVTSAAVRHFRFQDGAVHVEVSGV